MASGFASNSMLNELCIHDNSKDIDPSITEIGWHAIFSALYSPMCRLEKLELQSTRRDEDGVNDNRIASFARAMANNNKLKEFLFSGFGIGFRPRAIYNGYAAFTRVLCNSSSILHT